MVATLGSKGQPITLPSFSNVASSDRRIDVRLGRHGKQQRMLCSAASWDTAMKQQLQRRVALAASGAGGGLWNVGIVIRNTCG